MLICKFCNKECKNNNSFKNHERCCAKNENRIYKNGMLGKQGGNQFTKAKQLGLPTPIVKKETIVKNIESRRKNGTLKRTEKQKNNTSIAMKKAVEKYPESYTSSNRGRTKQIIVDGIKLQGKWEVDFYLWAKNNDLNPQRPTKSFKYEWNGIRTYHPDFYIESLDLYIEVKGYETDRDKAKWLHFPERLCIIKKKEIEDIRKGCFSGPIAQSGSSNRLINDRSWVQIPLGLPKHTFTSQDKIK